MSDKSTRDVFDWSLLRRDFFRRSGEVPYRELAPLIGLSASTLCRMGNGKQLSVEALVLLLRWLKRPFSRYV